MNADWLIPQWPAPAHVHALFTTRSGGTSKPPFHSFNVGDHVGDSAADVTANRAVLRQAMGARPVFLSQVHGTHVAHISDLSTHGTLADGCITAQPGVACTIMVADCLPVLFTNTQGTLVAAVHAGWRSLAGERGQGVLEQVFKDFEALALMDSARVAIDLIAWMGPCIGPDAFEVGDDVRDIFLAQDPQAQRLFKPQAGGKWLADLPGLARMRLQALGVSQIYGNDGSRDWCTVSQPSKFFSYRRDRISGRMAACIWRD